MADRNDGSIAPRRSLSGPILPPPPPEMAEEARKAEEARRAAEARKAEESRKAEEAKAKAQREKAEKKAARDAARAKRAEKKAAQKAAPKKAPAAAPKPTEKYGQQQAREPSAQEAGPTIGAAAVQARPEPAPPPSERLAPTGTPAEKPTKATRRPRRTRRARLRLVQVDAWSVMKTSFLLSIALGIVLVVAVAIIWAVLGAAGVWDSINSIVQQAIGGEGEPFDIEEYAGTSRVLGFTMIVAVIDVILITAISTLGAFLYNLSAALLGGIEVTLAEDN